MNIFALDLDPIKCAQYHCDKHVVKMITEYSQLLSTAAHIYYPALHNPEIMYKSTHRHHPCTKWVGENLFNYTWLNYLLKHLIKEYEYRYENPDNFIRSKEISSYLGRQLHADFRGLHITPFSLCMPDHCKVQGVEKHPQYSVLSYRKYYQLEKINLHKWTKRQKPAWL